jgi:hypothetical protein
MQARVGVLLRGSLQHDGWFGCANEVAADRAAEVRDGGVHVAADDIVLERAARAGQLAPARWAVTADPAPVNIHHRRGDTWT